MESQKIFHEYLVTRGKEFTTSQVLSQNIYFGRNHGSGLAVWDYCYWYMPFYPGLDDP